MSKLTCPSCGSTDIEMKLMQENLGSTVVTTTKAKSKTKTGHGCLWWLIIGWWWWIIDLFVWIFAFIPRLLIQIFKPKKARTKSNTTTATQEIANIEYKTVCMCRDCGHHWQK